MGTITPVSLESVPHSTLERILRELLECPPSGSLRVVRIKRLHCVPQPTSCVRNRDGTIMHGIQLVQSTGLEAAGHQQDVCSCCEAVGEGHVEAHPASGVVGELLLHPPEPIL